MLKFITEKLNFILIFITVFEHKYKSHICIKPSLTEGFLWLFLSVYQEHNIILMILEYLILHLIYSLICTPKRQNLDFLYTQFVFKLLINYQYANLYDI